MSFTAKTNSSVVFVSQVSITSLSVVRTLKEPLSVHCEDLVLTRIWPRDEHALKLTYSEQVFLLGLRKHFKNGLVTHIK